MPARNAEETIAAAIDSIRAQDFTDFEFILVDHRSEDSTHALMLRAAEVDTRIRVFRCAGTFVEAANLGAREASGEYLARMDSDDFASPNRLSLQWEFLNQHPEIDACGSLVRICKRGSTGESEPADEGYQRYESWINSVVSPEQIRKERFVDSPIPNPTAMVRRSVFEAVGGYHDPSWAEDYDFWLRLIEEGYSIGKVPEVLLDWYDSPDRSTRTIDRYRIDQFQRAKSHFLTRLPNIKTNGVALCGAGPTGKEMAQFLTEQSVITHCFLEVNPRQIGQIIGGVAVIDHERLGELSKEITILSAVGNPTSRQKIRGLVTAAGWIEGENFFCVA